MTAADRLADVLSRENEALRRMDFKTAVALIPEKEAALVALEQSVRPKQDAGPRLAALAAENRVLLERAIATQARVVRLIAKAGSQQNRTSYGPGKPARPRPMCVLATA